VPLYEYGCEGCRKRSSALLPNWSAPDPPCAHCGSKRVRRLVSSFAAPRSGTGGEGDFGEDAYEEGGFEGGGGYGDEGGFDDF
jgi:putative FmdB family regulatory protein